MNNITSYKRLSLVLALAMVMTACGGGGKNTEPTGLDRIVEYAQNGGTVPRIQDYLDAGISGIDSNIKLEEINQVVEGLVAEDVDTIEELQAIADALGVDVSEGSVAPSPSPSPTPTLDNTPPVITLIGATPVSVIQFTTYADVGATAIDNVNGSVVVTSTNDINLSKSGTYTVTYSATDAADNSVTATRTVNVIAFSITHNGTTYGAVKSPYTGKVWLDRNLGAAQVCASFNDTACYGDYYQWGRNFDGHQDSLSGTTDTLANNVTAVGHGSFITNNVDPYNWASVDSNGSIRSRNWSVTDGTSVCPVGFRVPTIAELKAELVDTGSAEIKNRDDAFNSFLKLPSAGYRLSVPEELRDEGLFGSLWSSTAKSSYAFRVFFTTSMNVFGSKRTLGFSLRCLRD